MDERAESVDHQSDLQATLSFSHAPKLGLRIVESYLYLLNNLYNFLLVLEAFPSVFFKSTKKDIYSLSINRVEKQAERFSAIYLKIFVMIFI